MATHFSEAHPFSSDCPLSDPWFLGTVPFRHGSVYETLNPEAIKNSLSDPRRSNEKITSLFDLLTTIFGARTEYQKKFIENGSIGVVVDILKQTSSIEGFEG